MLTYIKAQRPIVTIERINVQNIHLIYKLGIHLRILRDALILRCFKKIFWHKLSLSVRIYGGNGFRICYYNINILRQNGCNKSVKLPGGKWDKIGTSGRNLVAIAQNKSRIEDKTPPTSFFHSQFAWKQPFHVLNEELHLLQSHYRLRLGTAFNPSNYIHCQFWY